MTGELKLSVPEPIPVAIPFRMKDKVCVPDTGKWRVEDNLPSFGINDESGGMHNE